MKKPSVSKSRANSSGISHGIFDDVVNLASTLFQSTKGIGGDRLQSLADATQTYAATMSDLPSIQQQINLASENISNFADYIHSTDVKDIVSDAKVLARQRPILTVLISAVAGLVATRMVVGTQSHAPSRSGKRKAKKSGPKSRSISRGNNGSTAEANA